MQDPRIAIMTDSSCDLADDLLQANAIRFAPLLIIYDTQEYRDRVEITAQQVYDRLGEEVPRSSLPHAQDVLDIWDDLQAQGYTDVLYLSISAGLSGSYNMIRLLAQQYTGLRVHVQGILSMGLGFLALEAAGEIRRGGTVASAIARVQRIRADMSGMFVIRTLEYLKKGGRIGRVQAVLGSVMDLKPIIGVGLDGVYHTLARVRGFSSSVRKLVALASERYAGKKINLAIVHGGTPEEAEQLANDIAQRTHVLQRYIEQVSPVLGVHTGPGLLGVIAYEAI